MARPKSTHAHAEVIKAALILMAERGIDATSMDAIAERAGVSKATIYNHWQDKEALILDAMAHLLGHHERPAFNTGDTRADMIAVLSHQPPRTHAALHERIMPHLVAYSALHQKFGEAWRHQAMEPPRCELTRLIEQGIRHGELIPQQDISFSLAMLLGPVMYRRIFQRTDTDLAANLPERVVDAYWRAFGTHSNPPERKSRKK
ncbi:putative HTH-type transcriptional regulator YdeS [Edaphobacter acidisoli]|uniref:HTH-type transcriptional regulator YdeS n=1 Tax=Edaphobacter acidisoli TaxID=2040573 RepID=A0A916W6D0_9BACT|nr:TetR/AcrR family transcriptional regulator [Edaphobacter acidisoli]GGA70681.1 putative HTH-type transcriptional regulator YdeS [Edaphobacter acidisoli]